MYHISPLLNLRRCNAYQISHQGCLFQNEIAILTVTFFQIQFCRSVIKTRDLRENRFMGTNVKWNFQNCRRLSFFSPALTVTNALLFFEISTPVSHRWTPPPRQKKAPQILPMLPHISRISPFDKTRGGTRIDFSL